MLGRDMNKEISENIKSAVSLLGVDETKQSQFESIIKGALLNGVKANLKSISENHQQRGFNKNWRPWLGWLGVFAIVNTVIVEPVIHLFTWGTNYGIPNDTLIIILGVTGLTAIGRSVEKFSK